MAVPNDQTKAAAAIPVYNVFPYQATPLGYQQITSLSSATSLTVPTGATWAIVECDSVAAQGVRWRDDGTAPTATVGMELLPGASFSPSNITAVEFIQVAASAKLNVSYYK